MLKFELLDDKEAIVISEEVTMINLRAVVGYLSQQAAGGLRLPNGAIIPANFVCFIDERELTHIVRSGAATPQLMECIRLGRPVGTGRSGGETTGMDHRPSFAHQRVKRPIRQRASSDLKPRF